MRVNVSARQFGDGAICSLVSSAIAAAKIDPSMLVLEITEGIAVEDSGASLERLRELKALGVRLAIDGLGTGYSSLSSPRLEPRRSNQRATARGGRHEQGYSVSVTHNRDPKGRVVGLNALLVE